MCSLVQTTNTTEQLVSENVCPRVIPRIPWHGLLMAHLGDNTVIRETEHAQGLVEIYIEFLYWVFDKKISS